MNPTLHPQNFVLSILYASQVKKYLEDRNADVESNFATRQGLVGWMLGDPWLYAFFMQSEISRLDAGGGDLTKAEEGTLQAQLRDAQNKLTAAKADAARLEGERNAAQTERDAATADAARLEGERNAARTERDDAKAAAARLEAERDAATAEAAAQKRRADEFEQKFNAATAEAAAQKQRADGLQAQLDFWKNARDTAWRNLQGDLDRQEVYISIEDAKVILMGLHLQGTPDSQDFKSGFLRYARGWFQTPEADSKLEAPPEAPAKKRQPASLRSAEAPDDLTEILGIGKVIQTLLNRHGIRTFAQLSETSAEELDAMLQQGQVALGITHPPDWMEQARLLAQGKREEWLEWKRKHRSP